LTPIKIFAFSSAHETKKAPQDKHIPSLSIKAFETEDDTDTLFPPYSTEPAVQLTKHKGVKNKSDDTAELLNSLFQSNIYQE